MTIPRDEPQQQPCRCETCDIHKKVCADLPRYYGKGSGNPSSGCKLYDMMDTEPDFSDAYWNAIALVGCASHSANTGAQARIDAVVKELEKAVKKSEGDLDRSRNTEIAYRNGMLRAIALLKEGVGK